MSTTGLATIVIAAAAMQLLLLTLVVWRQSQKRTGRLLQGRAGIQPWSGVRQFRVVRASDEDDSGSIRSLYLAPVDGKPLTPYMPGQYLTVELGVPAGDGATRPIVRCYSLSDAPTPAAYRISVKRVPPPAGSSFPPGIASTFLQDRVKEGDTLSVRAPMGHFVPDSTDPRPVVLIGGGVGITPLWSMLKAMLSSPVSRDIWFLYAARNGDEHPFRTELAELVKANPHLHVTVAYSRPGARDRRGQDYQIEGRIDGGVLRRILPSQDMAFYVCGPAEMMEALVPALLEWGVPAGSVHYETFGPASLPSLTGAEGEPMPPKADGVLITFAQSGRTLRWEGKDETLLALAERNGIEIQTGCRVGHCGTCETRVEQGMVRYPQPPGYDARDGYCLVCMAQPASDLVLTA